MDVEVKKCHRIQRQTWNETQNKKLEKKKKCLKKNLPILSCLCLNLQRLYKRTQLFKALKNKLVLEFLTRT
jgi:hypothetical protein